MHPVPAGNSPGLGITQHHCTPGTEGGRTSPRTCLLGGFYTSCLMVWGCTRLRAGLILCLQPKGVRDNIKSCLLHHRSLGEEKTAASGWVTKASCDSHAVSQRLERGLGAQRSGSEMRQSRYRGFLPHCLLFCFYKKKEEPSHV